MVLVQDPGNREGLETGISVLEEVREDPNASRTWSEKSLGGVGKRRLFVGVCGLSGG